MKRRGFLKTLAVAIPVVAIPTSLVSKPIKDERKHKSGVFALDTPRIMNVGDVFECVFEIYSIPLEITNKCILYGFNWKDYGGVIEVNLNKLDLNELSAFDELRECDMFPDYLFEHGMRMQMEETDALFKRLAI